MLGEFSTNDGVSALLELSWAPLIDVKVACATALCRLSLNQERAALLARNRAITELMSMLVIPHTPLQQLAVSCIVNLIFHGNSFPDRVFLGEPHAIQSPLGLVNVLSLFAASPATSQFVVETLFNLSLYRASCLSVIRGGGAEILSTIVTQLCKLVDGGGSSSSRYLYSMGAQTPAWVTDMSICMKLLRLAADTLANFSVFLEYHNLVGSHGIKMLILMLSGALRDVGNFNVSMANVERFRCTSVSCSRSLVNFSCNTELRRQNFPVELIHLTSKLALMDHQRYSATAQDARLLLRNTIRALCNLSFEASCRTTIMEIPNLFTMLNAIIILPSVVEGDVETPLWYLSPSQSLNSSSFPWTVDMSEDVKEDALIMLLNLAQESTCSNELLRTLDGKLIAAAAEDFGHSRRLRYIYNSVLSNLLFDNCLQQLVYGDQVVRALVNGFYFFEANDDLKDPLRRDAMSPSSERTQFQELNLAFEDDQERFLASMYIIANELMDVANIELVVALVLPCMQTYLDLIEPILSNASSAFAQRVLLQRQLPIVSYASASLFALTRAANQRRDSHKHVIYSEETEAVLISVSALPSGAGGGGSSSGLLKGGAAQAFCAATLYHLCASTSANQRIMQGLINCCNTNEESQPLLACSAAFAITSFTPEGCQQLVECAHLARALNRLGRSSHVECQQYAAIAACNVSTVACVWTSAELKDFIVVAILRANSIQTKQIHAKTLSNLLSHTDSRAQVVEDGVLYALMKLSQVVLSIFSIGLRALFNLSCDHQYHHKLLSNGIMSYLSTAQQQQQNLASNLSTETRRLALAIICNLTSYEENHEELIRAQVTEIICNYVDEDIELRVSAAMALRNLSCRQPWVEMLCERKILQLLISCMECKHPVARQFGVEALANCSLVTDSLHLFGEMKVPRAAMKLLEIVAKSVVDTSSNEVVSWEFTNSNTTQHERGHTGASTYMAALKCLQNIAYDDALALVVMEEKVVLRLIPLIEHRDLGNDISACELAASLAHTLAGKAKCAEALLRQRTVSLCSLLHRHHASSSIIAQECVRVLMLLSTYQPIQLQLCETKVVHVVVNICGSGGASTSVPRNLRLRECGAVTIRNLTLSVTEHQMLFYDKSDRQESLQGAVVSNSEQQGNRLKTLQNYNSDKKDLPVSLVLERHMLQGVKYFQDEIASGRTSDRIMLEASAAIANLSTTKLFRIAMVRLGVIPTLLQVMNHTKTKTQPTSTPSQRPASPPLRARKSNHTTINLLLQICAATLHRLVVEDDAAVDTRNQLVPSLLSVLRQTDEDLQQVRYECEKISIFSSNTDDTITSPSSHGKQKWMVYLLKTILSSQAMIPHLEKKQMRTMGLPKLCFQELAPASICETPLPASNSDINNSRSTSAPNESNTLCDGNYRKGYLLPVNMEKHVLSRINGFDEIVPASMVTALPRAKSAGTSSTRPIISSGRSSSANSSRTQASALIDPLGHTRKFNRQMQLTRRNNRRGDSCLPPV
ncbi:hypothetical protein PHMEG_0008569 [Phytophthora megakarya]|uniref:Vacuolar protein 8 n=1 Tax=Phytophthora megakarya TaxID=4795 RepID=A0A225WKV3_9STRA|nr:hypothetical protein PHMEG_0008569 [Phytophthora megakarya]